MNTQFNKTLAVLSLAVILLASCGKNLEQVPPEYCQ